MLFFTVTDDVRLHNVALNKTSSQVSVYKDQFGTTYAASLGNDGIVNSCVRSERETNAWWAVDLEVETLVAEVNLTNGDDAGIVISSLRFTNFLHLVCITWS